MITFIFKSKCDSVDVNYIAISVKFHHLVLIHVIPLLWRNKPAHSTQTPFPTVINRTIYAVGIII